MTGRTILIGWFAAGVLSAEPVNLAAPKMIDPDAQGALAPVPLTLVEPPKGVRLPGAVARKDEWRGVRCGVIEPAFASFTSPEKWESFWLRGAAPYAPVFRELPKIDFSRDMVVGVFMGEQPQPFYEIEIRSIDKEASSSGLETLVIRYREIRKMTGLFAPNFPVQPFHLKRIPAWSGRLRFEKTR